MNPRPHVPALIGLPAVGVLLALSVLSCTMHSKAERQAENRTKALNLLDEGIALEGQGLYQQAIQRYLSAVDLSPSPKAYYQLGHCYSQMREYDTAVVYLQKAVDASPDFNLAYLELVHAEEMVKAGGVGGKGASAAGPGPRDYAPAETGPIARNYAAVEQQKVEDAANASGSRALVFNTADEFRPPAIRPPEPGAHAQNVRTRPVSPGAMPAVRPPDASSSRQGLGASSGADLTVVPRPSEGARLPYQDAPRPEGRPPVRPVLPPAEDTQKWDHLVDKPLPPIGVDPSREPAPTVAKPGATPAAEVPMSDVYSTLFGPRTPAGAPAAGVGEPKKNPPPSYSTPGISGPSFLGQEQFYINTADRLMKEGEHQKAAGEYIEALRINDRNASVRARLAEAYMHTGEKDKAEAQLKRAREIDPRNFEAAYRLADLYWGVGRYQEALTEAEAAWALDNQTAEAAILLGDIYGKLERQEKAETMYKKARDLQPESPRPLWKMGNLRLDVKDYKQARSLYYKALELDPKFIPALNNLGALDRLEGDAEAARGNKDTAKAAYDSARKQWEKIVEIDPGWSSAYYNLAILYEMYFDQPKEAIRYYEKCVKLGGNRADDARAAIAQIKSKSG